MKKTTALIVSFLFVLAFAGLSFAEEKKEAVPAPAKEKKKMDEKEHPKKAWHYAHGEVTAVDAAANTLTIKGKKDEATFTIDDKTEFHTGKTLADVKVGDKLTVKYAEMGGKIMAASITRKTAHHHEKREMKEQEKKEEKK